MSLAVVKKKTVKRRGLDGTLKKRVRSKFIVDLTNRTLFTSEDLELSKIGFNPETTGFEYLYGYEDQGVEYSHKQFMSTEEISEIVDSATNKQLYRKGDNTKRTQIRNSIRDGFDLREKGIFVIVDDNDKVKYVFSGNTTHKTLCELHPHLENRIVHVFKMIDGPITLSQASMIGARHNALSRPEDQINWDTCEEIINRKFSAKEYNISKKSTPEQLEMFRAQVREDIAFMGNGKFCSGKKTQIDRLLIQLTKDAKGEETLLSFISGEACISYLQKLDPINFADNQRYVSNKSVSIDYPSKTFHYFSGMVNERLKLSMMNNPTVALPEDTTYNIVCNFGTIDPSKVLSSIEKKVKEWYSTILTHNKAVESFVPKGRWKIQGFINQSKELETFAKEKGIDIPFGEVTDVKTWLDLYELDHEELIYMI